MSRPERDDYPPTDGRRPFEIKDTWKDEVPRVPRLDESRPSENASENPLVVAVARPTSVEDRLAKLEQGQELLWKAVLELKGG
jgi:hypothetical protein